MSWTMTAVVSAAAGALVVWAGWRAIARGRRGGAIAGLAALALYLVLLHFLMGFPSLPGQAASKGAGEGAGGAGSAPLVLAMFLCMMLGMGAEYVYHYLDGKAGERKFDWGSFCKPFLVSPLVFVPLAASLENAQVDVSRFSVPVMMLFLVAFENGFLWRGYFARKLAEAGGGGAGK